MKEKSHSKLELFRLLTTKSLEMIRKVPRPISLRIKGFVLPDGTFDTVKRGDELANWN